MSGDDSCLTTETQDDERGWYIYVYISYEPGESLFCLTSQIAFNSLAVIQYARLEKEQRLEYNNTRLENERDKKQKVGAESKGSRQKFGN